MFDEVKTGEEIGKHGNIRMIQHTCIQIFINRCTYTSVYLLV